MFPVNVSPDMAMYNLLKSQGYDTSYALAEYIDNAIHAWQQVKGASSPLSVTIKFYSHNYKVSKKRNSIEIIDTGPGIARNQIESAFKPAKLPASKGLSEFGIGMKTASVWFADEWELSTRPNNDTKQYHFKFNLGELLESGADTVNVKEELNNGKNGTTILLHNLRRPIDNNKYEEICADICELYQRFTSGDGRKVTLLAQYDDTPKDLNFPETDRAVLNVPVYKTIKGTLYAIGKKRKWEEPVSFEFMGCKVHGEIKLLETGSYTSNPGMILFRHNRVIMGTNRTPYIPEKLFDTANKYGRQRIYAELHLDDLPVSYTKDSFEFDEDIFVSTIKKSPAILELLRQSKDYRVKEIPIPIESEDVLKSTDGKGKSGQGKKGNTSAGSSDNGKGGNGQPGGANGDTNHNKGEPVAPVTSVTVLKALSTAYLALQDVIGETIYQYENDRPIAAALCFRIVLETGVLRKIERDFAAEYPKVSEKSIQALVKYIHSNSTTFFGKAEHMVSKCVQSLANGTQQDVIVVNNVAHGHYHPTTDELDKLIGNLQPLLEWAYT
jgi:hypothetical protein